MNKRLLFLILIALSVAVLSFAMSSPRYRSDEFNKAAIDAYDAIDRFQTHAYDQQSFMREVEAENALTALGKASHSGIEGNVEIILHTYFRAVKRYQFDLGRIEQYPQAKRDNIAASISKQNWQAMCAAHSWNPS